MPDSILTRMHNLETHIANEQPLADPANMQEFRRLDGIVRERIADVSKMYNDGLCTTLQLYDALLLAINTSE